MKIKGKKFTKPNTEVVVIPRGDGEDLVFKAQAVLNTDDFDQLCPYPKAPTVTKRGGEKFQDLEDPVYKEKVQAHGRRKLAWLVIQSLRATEGLEWDEVNYSDPDTWEKYTDELKSAYLTEFEIAHIINAVMMANSLNEDRLDEARDRFLAGLEEQLENS